MRRSKLYVGICLVVQCITYLIVFISSKDKRRNPTRLFLLISALGGIFGAALLIQHTYEEEVDSLNCSFDDYFDDFSETDGEDNLDFSYDEQDDTPSNA